LKVNEAKLKDIAKMANARQIFEYNRNLEYQRHKNAHLQNIYNKYGSNSLVYMILEECEKEKLLERETHYYNLIDEGLRLNKQYPTDMRSMTEREIAKATAKRWTKPFPESGKQRLREKMLGKEVSQETRKKMSEASLGIEKPPEQIEKLLPNLRIQWAKNKGARLPREWYENRKFKQLSIELVRTIKKDLEVLTDKEASTKYDIQLKTIKKLRIKDVWNKKSIV
jgi:hypothetical protein